MTTAAVETGSKVARGDVVRWAAPEAGARTLPVRAEPAGAKDAATLAGWLTENTREIQARLAHHGAILFRGFDLADPKAFEQVARAIDPALKKDYLGTSPRDALTEYVFSASELPPVYPIPQHCEISFIKAPPRRLFFCCLIPNQGPGGETPLCDVRHVYRDLDPAVRARFDERGVRTIRNYAGPAGGGRDLWQLKRWDEMFRTTDPAVVERTCAANGLEWKWHPGGRLTLLSNQPAWKAHPVTGERAWFNHSQVFHVSAVPAEYRRIVARQPSWTLRGLAALSSVMVAAKKLTTKPEELAMHCTYGDGSAISDADMDAVREAIWKNLRFEKWQLGDVVAIDNDAVAHGRMPYSGPRKIAVCWA